VPSATRRPTALPEFAKTTGTEFDDHTVELLEEVSLMGPASVAPVLSSIRLAETALGAGLGIARGSDPEPAVSCSMLTRAWALTYSGLTNGKNEGTLVSVSLMSMAASEQGEPLRPASLGADW